jgi:hypothetical protein
MAITLNGSTGIVSANIADGTIAAADLASGAARANFGTGAVLQVVQSYIRGAHTATTSTSYVTTGLSASITPSSTSSKILVTVSLTFSASMDTYGVFNLYRNGSEIVNARSGTATGNKQNGFIAIAMRDGDTPFETEEKTKMFLDSPNSTSAQTYEIYWKKTYGGTIILGRPIEDSDNSYVIQTPFAITLMEIAG